MSEEIKNNGTPEIPAEPSAKQDRKEYMARYYAENKDEIAERRKAARLARQEEINAADREAYANDPNLRERKLNTKAKSRKAYNERIATDPEAQKQHQERLAIRRQRHQERLATDPEYRKQREEFTTALREKRKKEKKGEDEP